MNSKKFFLSVEVHIIQIRLFILLIRLLYVIQHQKIYAPLLFKYFFIQEKYKKNFISQIINNFHFHFIMFQIKTNYLLNFDFKTHYSYLASCVKLRKEHFQLALNSLLPHYIPENLGYFLA